MPEDLTNSKIDRQNILNNPYARLEIQKATQIKGIEFERTVWLVKECKKCQVVILTLLAVVSTWGFEDPKTLFCGN